jgi:hypothetical protein
MTGRGRVPRVLRGTLVTKRRKCGKANCRCSRGLLHESPVLSVSVEGRSVTISLDPAELPAVRAALARYQQAREELDSQASAGLSALRTSRRR